MHELSISFMRHGVAVDPGDFTGPDRERPLTADGRDKCLKAARGYLRRFQPSWVLTSPLLRARQTADLVMLAAQELSLPIKGPLVVEALALERNWEDWLEYLQHGAGDWRAQPEILAIGHEPNLSLFTARHLGLRSPHWTFKKSGVAVVELSTDFEEGELVAFLPPKVLR